MSGEYLVHWVKQNMSHLTYVSLDRMHIEHLSVSPKDINKRKFIIASPWFNDMQRQKHINVQHINTPFSPSDLGSDDDADDCYLCISNMMFLWSDVKESWKIGGEWGKKNNQSDSL